MTFARPPETAVRAVRRFSFALLAAGFVVSHWTSAAEAAPTQASTNEHWAFRAPLRVAVPEVKRKRWPRNPIDHFVLAKLEQNKLAPSPEADRVTLIRRL